MPGGGVSQRTAQTLAFCLRRRQALLQQDQLPAGSRHLERARMHAREQAAC